MKKVITIVLAVAISIGIFALGNSLGPSYQPPSPPASQTPSLPEGIMRAEEWKNIHPDIYASYMANSDMVKTTYGGSEPIDYLEEYPNLKVFYDGYGFSKEYLRARGHVYALEDVINTARPKAGASCLSCKTADFTEELAKGGVSVNTMDFQVFVDEHPDMTTISCYDCHRNTPGVVDLTRAHLTKALESVDGEISTGNLACAQCHVEYYMEAETKEVILPWKIGFDTDSMLAYYDDEEFKDWVHPTTGASMLKAQHPEFETFQGSIHYNFGVSCTDCHMPEIEGDKNLKSHHWTSPLLSDEGLEASCARCHGDEPKDRIAAVEAVQKGVYNKTNEVSDLLADYVNRLSKAVEAGDIKEEDLANLQDIHRKAQFKWDFVFVENSEGFHNSALAHGNLDSARKLLEEGIKILEDYEK